MNILRMLSVIVICLALVPAAEGNNPDCMDCGERYSQDLDPSGQPLWPRRVEALCCDFPCVGGYEIKQHDVGWQCYTCARNNEIVVGSVCCSGSGDRSCPGSTSGTNDTWNQNGGTDGGCVRDSTGACPAQCSSCT